jgi:hypothetical protein
MNPTTAAVDKVLCDNGGRALTSPD